MLTCHYFIHFCLVWKEMEKKIHHSLAYSGRKFLYVHTMFCLWRNKHSHGTGCYLIFSDYIQNARGWGRNVNWRACTFPMNLESVRQNPVRRAASVWTKMSTACLQLCLHSAFLPFGGLALRTCLYLSNLKCKWVKVYLEVWGSLSILEMLSYGSFRKQETFKKT